MYCESYSDLEVRVKPESVNWGEQTTAVYTMYMYDKFPGAKEFDGFSEGRPVRFGSLCGSVWMPHEERVFLSEMGYQTREVDQNAGPQSTYWCSITLGL